MAHTTLPFAQWAALAREKRAEAVPVARDVAAEPTLSNGKLVDVRMSTANEDRARDTIALAGWQVARFLANPLLLWCHDSRLPPIGQVRGVAVEGEALIGKEIVFLDESLASGMPDMDDDHLSFAMMIGRMYLHPARFLRAFSVGLIPLKWAWNEERGGVDFLEQELLELSACDIPMNPDCLSGAKSAGIELAPLLVRAEKKLDADALAPGWLSTRQASAIYRSLSAPRVAVPSLKREIGAGSRVAIIGAPHEEDHAEGMTGIIRVVDPGPAYGIEIDGRPGKIHRWYTASEVDASEKVSPLPPEEEEPGEQMEMSTPAPAVKSSAPTPEQLASAVAEMVKEELFKLTGRLPD